MLPDSIRREPDAELYAAMGRDVGAAGSRRQVQLPLQLQVLLGSRFEDAGGQAPTIVSDPMDQFPAPVLAFYALREDARQNGCSGGLFSGKPGWCRHPTEVLGADVIALGKWRKAR